MLECPHVAHACIINQVLQEPSIANRRTNLRHQIVWNVDRESPAPVPTVKCVAAVTSSSLASLAVLRIHGLFRSDREPVATGQNFWTESKNWFWRPLISRPFIVCVYYYT